MSGQWKVADLMSADVVTLTEDETLAHAQRCMARGRIRHRPVLRGRKLVGLITHRDLLAASFSIFAEVDFWAARGAVGLPAVRPAPAATRPSAPDTTAVRTPGTGNG